MTNPVSSKVTVKVADTPEEAPNYPEDVKLLWLKECILVGEGMQSGAPSADLQLVDENGNKYVVMTSGGILEMLGGAAAGKRDRDEAMKKLSPNGVSH